MISLGFTKKDAVRAFWTFVFTALGVIVVAQPTTADAWKVAGTAAVAAGISAVKNLVLRDGTVLKG